MKIFISFFIGILTLILLPISMKAQDVYITVPSNNIFNRSEFITLKTVMNTGSHSSWRSGGIDPTIWAIDSEYFSQALPSSSKLPTSVLHWRLASIGGNNPNGGSWPGFKWFTEKSQTWYQPTIFSRYTNGDVVFTFKIPSDKFSPNTFVAGEYSLNVGHNYGPKGWYVIEFTPDDFQVVISVPAAIQWISNTPTKLIEIASLNSYRQMGEKIIGDFGTSTIGNTLDFNLLAKTTAATIQFTSTKGVTASRPASTLKLGSTNPKIATLPLTSTLQNYSPTNNFKVEVGNRNDVLLQLSISESDFKTHFFEAGIYKFQLNLEAQSFDNTVSALQNTDVTIKVPSLSEITIPTSGNAVNFEFNSASHYQNGQTKIVTNQIKLSNNETYELYVKTDTPFFKRSGIQSDIPSSILQVGINGGSQNVSLSNTSQKIISNGSPVLDKSLDLKYTISPAAAQTLVSKEKSTYSINVIYSFTAL